MNPGRTAATEDLLTWSGELMTRRQSRSQWGVAFAGSGGYLPGRGITNDDLLARTGLATTSQWVREHTGIEQRHYADAGQATSDLAAEAVRRALADSGVDILEVSRILLCTTTGDWTSPAAANRVQYLLGGQCPVLDIQTACASWIFGLDLGARMIVSGLDNVVVVGADVKSRFLRRGDFRLGPVMADGAGAVLLSAYDGPDGLQQLELYSDGSKTANLITPAGGSALPASAETVAADLHTVQLGVPGGVIKEHAVFAMARLTEQVCAQQGITPAEVDWIVPHQANGAIVTALVRELDLPAERFVNTIAHSGNTVAATLPYAYDFAARSGRFRPGDRIVLTTAGAGYSAGAALYVVPGA
ncbi:MAG: ketoacyl-ACP synthase III [Geodermatophilaceae bacterium]|nr:ketoacyl-ACP synthase III [Geodermatophilaceae bacterium]